MTTKNYNVLFIQITNKLEEERGKTGVLNAESLAAIIREFDDPTNIMPSDVDFEKTFRQESLSNQNAREILFLIALYQVSTEFADVTRLSVGSYSVEHIMPVKWEANWLEMDMTAEQKAIRNRKLRSLGNLTLVTRRLNSRMQNAAWSEKRAQLRANSILRMTINYVDKEK